VKVKFSKVPLLLLLMQSLWSLKLITPYNCPYCTHKSTRKWSLKVHIDRKHGDEWNPVQMPIKKLTFNDDTRTLKKNSNSLLPDFDPNSPIQPSFQLQFLLQQIKRLSRSELTILLCAMNDQLIR
jgi:hypothetical protein